MPYSPTAGLPFDDEELESRLVWIWGSPRSGSTWLLRLLAHPLTVDDHAPLGFHQPPDSPQAGLLPVNESFLTNHLAPLLQGALYTESWKPVTLSLFFNLDARPNCFFSPQYEDVWRPEVRRLALVRFHALLERAAAGCKVSPSALVAIKEVNGPHAADLVMSICRRSRLIFLVRDGRDVLDSLMHAIGPGGFLFGGRSAFQGSKERSEWVRRNSNNWVGDMKTIQRAYDAHPPELRRTVSYEALREDAAATLGPLAEWLGLRHDAGWLEDAIESNAFEGVPKRERGPTSFFRSARPGAWKQNLTRKDRRVAEEIMGEKLAELGYG
ncbi:MAG: sulfotransferase [Solirubrobacterales bacterium]